MVIEEGAKDVVVPGNFPIGCSASYLTLFKTPNKTAYDENGCLKGYNAFSMYHNAELKLALEKLRQKYPQTRIIYADYYGAANDLFHIPRHLGKSLHAYTYIYYFLLSWNSQSTYMQYLVNFHLFVQVQT